VSVAIKKGSGEDLINMSEVARRLGCSVEWVSRLVEKGVLVPTQVFKGLVVSRYFDPVAIEAYKEVRLLQPAKRGRPLGLKDSAPRKPKAPKRPMRADGSRPIEKK